MYRCQKNGKNALLISFDFRKAFDTVEWEAIYLALKKFGFGDYYINLVRIIYTNPLVCVCSNGFWSAFISPTRATRQGCCYSPGIFNLVIELLGLGIRQNVNIKGIQLNTEEIKAGQYANDLWTILMATKDNVDKTIKEILEFGTYSGLRLNFDKCAVIRIGPFCNSEVKFYTLRRLYWSPNPIKVLGFQIYPDWNIMYKETFENTLKKADKIFDVWKGRGLSPIGKITLVNNLVNTLFIHKLLALLSPPECFFKMYRTKVIALLWDGKNQKLRTKSWFRIITIWV